MCEEEFLAVSETLLSGLLLIKNLLSLHGGVLPHQLSDSLSVVWSYDHVYLAACIV